MNPKQKKAGTEEETESQEAEAMGFGARVDGPVAITGAGIPSNGAKRRRRMAELEIDSA